MRHVELLAGLVELTLCEDLRGRDDAAAVTHLDAGRDNFSSAGICADRARLLIDQILKLDLTALKPRGVHVREVVRDRVEIELLRLHARGAGVK